MLGNYIIVNSLKYYISNQQKYIIINNIINYFLETKHRKLYKNILTFNN